MHVLGWFSELRHMNHETVVLQLPHLSTTIRPGELAPVKAAVLSDDNNRSFASPEPHRTPRPLVHVKLCQSPWPIEADRISASLAASYHTINVEPENDKARHSPSFDNTRLAIISASSRQGTCLVPLKFQFSWDCNGIQYWDKQNTFTIISSYSLISNYRHTLCSICPLDVSKMDT